MIFLEPLLCLDSSILDHDGNNETGAGHQISDRVTIEEALNLLSNYVIVCVNVIPEYLIPDILILCFVHRPDMKVDA